MKITRSAKGFTLIELVIAIGFFGFISALLMQNIFSVYHFKEAIHYRKDINFEASAVLNNGIPGVIRSAFAINYEKTVSDKSAQPTEGMQQETDRISVYTDRAESQYVTIYREDYRSSGDNSDTARLMIQFNDEEPYPLHSSETVIEDFDVEVPVNPLLGGDRDIQPYVKLYVRARHRYPFGEPADEDELMAYQKARASYQTTLTLRNVGPGAYKKTS